MATANPHLRGIAIAGTLALVAVALGMYTLSRQQVSSSAATNTDVVVHGAAPVKHPAVKHTAAAAKPAATPAVKPKPAPKPHVAQENAFVKAALAADLPRPIALAFGDRDVVVVTLFRPDSDVDVTTRAEAQAGAALGGAAFVAVDASKDAVTGELTRAFGVLSAPTTLVLSRTDFTKPVTQLEGFVDRQTVQQAAYNASPTPGGSTAQSAWARRADALCATAQQQLLADPAGAKAAYRSLGAGLAALGGSGGEKKFAALARRELVLLQSSGTALTKQSPAAAAAAVVRLTTLKMQAGTAAMQLGAPSCSDLLSK